jgi:hypothetical protein
MKRSRVAIDFRPAPHGNAEAHKLVMQRLNAMSARDIFKTLVKAGIYTAAGGLTARYQAPAPKTKGSKAARKQASKRTATV